MSNRAQRHLGRRSPTHLRVVPPPAAPPPLPRSPLREAIETDGPGAYGARELAACVGGIDALERLDIEPLLPQPFDASAVPLAHRPLVVSIHSEMQAGIDAFNRPFNSLWTTTGLPELPPPFDAEYRAIAQRILLRLATANGGALARSTPRRTAAAIAWLAFRGNQKKRGRRRPEVTADGVWRAFNVSNCATLASALHRALNLPPFDSDDNWHDLSSLWLTDTQLLHSTARVWILRARTSAMQVCETLAREAAERRPVQFLPGGKVQIKARPVVPLSALRTPDITGRHTVVAMFGDLDDPEVIALSVPDAQRLIAILQRALDQPVSAG